MNELDTLKSFRAERDSEPPGAKEAIWRSLEARIEAASELASPPRSRLATRKPGLLSRRRRRLLAFAGAVAVAAIAAGSLVLHDGPTAQPASAAEILHRTAKAAAASDAPASLIPGPGQFLYRKEQRLEVMGWLYPLPAGIPDRPLSTGGGTMSGPGTFNALLPTTVERWTAPDGGGRIREVAGTPKFWNGDEEAAWKAAGSPLPPPFNAEYQQRFESSDSEANEIAPGVFDTDHKGWGNYSFPDTSGLPTEPVALRHAVESNTIKVSGFNLMFPKQQALNAEQTKEELLNILFEGPPSPQLGAAIFNALAEVPGVKVETGATDSLGRQGDMLTSAVKDGLRTEYLFDPTTGEELGSREVLVDPTASVGFSTLPAGTTVSEQDVLGSGVVDSTGETAELAG